jgi:hypothetical protein
MSRIQQNVLGLHTTLGDIHELNSCKVLRASFEADGNHFLDESCMTCNTLQMCQFQPETPKAQKILSSTSCWKSYSEYFMQHNGTMATDFLKKEFTLNSDKYCSF